MWIKKCTPYFTKQNFFVVYVFLIFVVKQFILTHNNRELCSGTRGNFILRRMAIHSILTLLSDLDIKTCLTRRVSPYLRQVTVTKHFKTLKFHGNKFQIYLKKQTFRLWCFPWMEWTGSMGSFNTKTVRVIAGNQLVVY